MTMPKKLEARRDELANRHLDKEDVRSGTWFSEGICLGFTACYAEMEPVLRRLRNEIKGLISAHECVIREDYGNTNLECVRMRIAEAEELLGGIGIEGEGS